MRGNFYRMTIPALLTVAGVFAYVQGVRGGDGGCAHCGCMAGCQKVCRLVDAPRKIPVTCWGCKTVDYCVPGPSQRGCKNIDCLCNETNDPKSPCVSPKKVVWWDWTPGCCAQVRSKNVLMKKTVTKTVPGFKWVVEDLCPQCQAACQTAQVPEGFNVPNPPQVADAILMPGEVVPVAVPDVPQELPANQVTPVGVPVGESAK